MKSLFRIHHPYVWAKARDIRSCIECQDTLKKIASDKPCGICKKGTMKFIITLKETFKEINNFDCQVIVIRQCNKCKEVDYDLDYGPEPSKVGHDAIKG